jgi:SAM-dependent methyltransferase
MSPELPAAANYHRWTHSWIAPYVRGARLLDIGGGTGNHLRHLDNPELVSVDVDEEAVEGLRARFAGRHPGWRFEVLDLTQPGSRQALGTERFDAVLSANVFEHVADDAALFQAAFQLLNPDGRLVLVVPAHGWLFGSLDRIAGHHRRYDRRLLEERLSRSGFTIEVIRYVNALGAIGWLLNSRLRRHTDITSREIGWQVRTFDRLVVPLARRLERRRHLPFGQSAVAVGRKPAAAAGPA